MYAYKIEVLKELYPSEVVLKTAYLFTDKLYIHITEDDKFWKIEIDPKADIDCKKMHKEFENALLEQCVRKIVFNKTQNIREMIMARAMSSSLVDTGNMIEQAIKNDENVNEDNLQVIMKDWFEHE